MKEKKILTTLEEIKAISEPFKYKILMTFYKMEQPATVKQIADAIDEVPANVHYHVKKMEKAGILELVYTKEIKGIIAKFYQPTSETFEIKYSSELTEPNINLMLAEGQQILAQVYDDSKNIFIKQLAYGSKTVEKANGIISMDDLYLTDDEALEFGKYVKDFMDKHKINDSNATDASKHHCFLSLFKVNSEE